MSTSFLALPHSLFSSFWCCGPAPPLPSLSFWISGSNIWRLRYRLGPSVIGLLGVIHFCNLGDGLMWSLHPCPYYDSVSVCREGRLVRGAIDWSFTLPALSALPLLLYPSFSLTHRAALMV